jgi:hypothetical protein
MMGTGISRGGRYFLSGPFPIISLVQNMAKPVARRIIMRIPCWREIHIFIGREARPCENSQWPDFLIQMSTGRLD